MIGNPALLGPIFRNLADNASAYPEAATPTFNCWTIPSKSATILVADNGIGVSDEHLPHLFERFLPRRQGAFAQDGRNGTRASIVKNAVMIHGGTISVRNRDRGGLEFLLHAQKKEPDTQRFTASKLPL